ncbi:MAG: hypothetical protein RLZZ292_1397 [Bacteroidota bacterium]|jgi:hypothetical protein
MEEEILRIDYDGNWKIITTELIEDWVAFFMPELNEDIDFSIAPEFKEQEFFEFVEEEQTKNVADKLVKFRLKNGEDAWIFIHIEFQTEGDISERMFTYYRRILDKFGKEITAIVIYTGRYAPKSQNKYEVIRYGTEVRYLFNSYVVAKQKESELLANNNPFAIVVLANLYVAKTHNNLRKRLTFKEKLYELAFSRGYSIEKITKLFIFVSELMLLSSELEKEYDAYVQTQQKIKKEENMRVLRQSTLNIINNLTKNAYGQSVDEMVQANQTIVQANQSIIQDKDAIIIRSIFNLKDSMNLTAAQIASILGVEIGYVEAILEKKSE